MKKQLLLLAVLASMVGVGCSSKTNTATPPVETAVTTNPAVDPGTPAGGGTGGGLSNGGGATVDFVPVSFSLFNSYVGTHPINSPKNIKISVNLTEVDSTLKYAGSVKISYEDNGQTFTGTFESGDGKNQSIDGLRDNDVYESTFNYWFSKDGKTVFSGIFQDALGSVVLVIDKTVDQGDGQGTGYVSGSVYFKNFAQSQATQSPYRKCWFIYVGPHDCRSTEVMQKSSITLGTGEGYRKLGTFTGLSKVSAFNL